MSCLIRKCGHIFTYFTIILWIVPACTCHHSTTGDSGAGAVSRWLPAGHGRRTKRQQAEEPCDAFSKDSPAGQEFYSPGWPLSYPNHTVCERVLEAPKGHLIRLDFRETFNLEPSTDCRFDFLEVRDGAHGYNALLGQFCGSEFPPMITSTDRFLWLRFHSDENIEYNGFKAVYEFIPRPTSSSFTPEVETCRMDVGGNEGEFNSGEIPKERQTLVEKYNIAIDCMWVITVKEGWKIQLTFPEFKLDKPNDCDSNFVDVFSDRTDLPNRQKNYCGSIADTVISRNNTMFVRFLAESKAIKSYFTALYTAFREKKGGEACADDEYDCEDATCIASELRCNGKVNCRFRWDEEECTTKKSMALNSEHIIIIMVIFSLILSGMCFTFVFNCVKKLIRDHRTIQASQEHIRQSREQQLNVLGHKGSDPSAVVTEAKKPLGAGRSRSNSSQSSGSRRFDETMKEPTPCYVPGAELLPILVKNIEPRHNGDMYGPMTTIGGVGGPPYPVSGGTYPGGGEFEQPQMCDSACQTRESLFAPVQQLINHHQQQHHHQQHQQQHQHQHHSPTPSAPRQLPQPSPPAPFSTFGYQKEDRYRAEAKIEVERVDKSPDKRRPYSVQTTKSAPDVIVTH